MGCFILCNEIAVAYIQDFADGVWGGGGANSESGKISPENCMKIKEIERGGGVFVSQAPRWIRQ